MTETEKPFDLPDGWAWSYLGEIALTGPTNGLSPRPSETPTDTRCLSLSATTRGHFKDDCFKYVAIDKYTAEPFLLKNDDLLIQRGNSLDYVGIAAIYTGEDDAFIYPDLMMRLKISTQINLSLVHVWLICEDGRNYFKRNATGTQGTMPKVNQATVARTPVPIPPAAEQTRIVARVTQLRDFCTTLRQRLAAGQTTQRHLAEALVEV